MKKIILLIILTSSFSYAQREVWVNTSTGGYYRTVPNSTNIDNYSTRGNINPHTGKAGTITPDYENSVLSALYGLNSQTDYNLPSPNSTVNYRTPEIYQSIPIIDTYQPPKSTNQKSSTPSYKGGKYFNIEDGKRNYIKQTISRL